MAGYPYSAKVPEITVTTLTLANTWYQVATEKKGVRKWKLKARESTYYDFQYAYADGATAYMTNPGAGISMDGCDLPNVWAKSSTAGVIIEVESWN